MVRLTRIYTRSGDDGSTGLADGSRRRKHDHRLQCYGTVDELNAILGFCSHLVAERPGRAQQEDAQLPRLAALLARIQNDLFDLGADLSSPGREGGLRVTAAQVGGLEKAIDQVNRTLSALDSFVLPGGSELACWLHLGRTVCRRAERWASQVSEAEPVGAHVLPYLNRLSDLLFVLARAANAGGEGDVLWVPGLHREPGE